jgi:hypothetical protein
MTCRALSPAETPTSACKRNAKLSKLYGESSRRLRNGGEGRGGPAFAVLTLVEAGRLELLLSAALISELRDVLFRTEVQQKFPGLSTEFIEVFLDHLQRMRPG